MGHTYYPIRFYPRIFQAIEHQTRQNKLEYQKYVSTNSDSDCDAEEQESQSADLSIQME